MYCNFITFRMDVTIIFFFFVFNVIYKKFQVGMINCSCILIMESVFFFIIINFFLYVFFMNSHYFSFNVTNIV